MKRGLYLAPFDELADPCLLAELARVASPEVGTACSCGIGSRIRPRTAPWPTHNLKAGSLDEMRIHLIPILLGGGVRLFEDLGLGRIELRRTSSIETPRATHFRFEVVK
jgi:hypothetical protein